MEDRDIYVLYRSIRERVGLSLHLELIRPTRSAKRSAGSGPYIVNYWTGQYIVDRNVIQLNRNNISELTLAGMREVLIHELAHAWFGPRSHKVGHGETFREKVREMGGVLVGETVNKDSLLIKK